MPSVVPSEVVRLIDSFFSFAAKPERPAERVGIDTIGRLSAIVALLDRLPSELLVMRPADYTDFVANLEILRGKVSVAAMHGQGYTFNAEPVWKLRHLLALCPDMAPTKAAHEMQFLDDRAHREDLRRDLSEAYQALGEGRYKAATVLAGSTIEALLVWRLSAVPEPERQAALESVAVDSKRRPKNLPEWWSFELLLNVSEHLQLFAKDTMLLMRLAKDYRNLIHPGRALRKAQRCGKDTALTGLAGTERLIEDLSK